LKQTAVKPANLEVVSPSNPLELARRGWVYYSQQNFDKAYEDFISAVQSDSQNIDFMYGLALTLKQLGKNQDAVQVFEKILSQIDVIDDNVKATMLKRLTLGHINRITQGDWNLGELVWHRKV
jgi:tetratricopeptide (TPR) repeat protein